MADSPSRPPDDTDTLSAAELRQRLDDAFVQVRLAARVEAAPDGTALDLTLLTAGRMPFDRDPAQANTWLTENGIDAIATFNECMDIVIRLRTAEAVHRLTSLLLGSRIVTHAAAAALVGTLAPHALRYEVAVPGAGQIRLFLHDSAGEKTVPAFAALLGGPGIEADLDLSRARGIRRITDRLSWLLTGITGSLVPAQGTPGCTHEPDQVELYLDPDQAQLLAQRLNRPNAPD
ncbi:hypothetical protein ABZV75_11640 [Streptomyces flaveolus]|uniref:hypothetical protein n=1 Tax=Streptomyces flaveolus TaxID=67297 RepID=UPI0033A93AB6